MSKKANDTEKEFDVFMSQVGFTRVSDDVGASPDFKNADYVNKRDKIIIELKVLEKEFFENGGTLDSLNAFIVQPVNIDEEGIGTYEFQIPDQNREGKHDNFEEPLRRIIKKANTQLKETKKHYFGDEECLGFTIIAQVGLQSLGADITALIVQKLLNHEFSSTDGAIVCTPYHRTKNPLTLKVNPACVSITNETSLRKKQTCMQIADKWVEFLNSGGHQ